MLHIMTKFVSFVFAWCSFSIVSHELHQNTETENNSTWKAAWKIEMTSPLPPLLIHLRLDITSRPAFCLLLYAARAESNFYAICCSIMLLCFFIPEMEENLLNFCLISVRNGLQEDDIENRWRVIPSTAFCRFCRCIASFVAWMN